MPLIPALFFFLLLLLATLAASQEFTYTGFGAARNGGAPNLTLNGVTELQPDGIMRLTNDTSRLKGHAFYPADDDGNATNHVFAVEFDTVQDFEFADINDNHVGVDLNSLTSNASASAAPINLKSGDTVLAWVDYDGDRRLLNVSIATLAAPEKPAAPLISFHVDLSIVFREQMYVGFSASTGLLASSHYLMGWTFKLGGGAAAPLDLSSLPSLPRPKPDKKSRTTLILASVFSAFVALLVLAGAGAYAAYRIKNREVIEPWELDHGPHRLISLLFLRRCGGRARRDDRRSAFDGRPRNNEQGDQGFAEGGVIRSRLFLISR
ncbi:unnamed protein product [Triticum turgidum subsp. durum]|uniref:Legume lectin domain-containing protein n=1 Tax=Triticum turgidum subsp. durum TaxID=4567 RepID=A0A9R0THK2_TRITD|nr:unnamed protein product [Triticum turgidum subsp. durum]